MAEIAAVQEEGRKLREEKREAEAAGAAAQRNSSLEPGAL